MHSNQLPCMPLWVAECQGLLFTYIEAAGQLEEA
jgi:hypothetical protein